MNLLLATAILLVGGFSQATPAAEPEKSWAHEKGITDGVLIKGSTSPDGKFALYEFNHWDGDLPESATTATAIGLAPVDRSKLLFIIDSRTKWMTDQEVTSFLTVMWNRNSTLVATQDFGPKHSRMHIYRLQNGVASSLEIPDLLPIACTKLRVSQASVTASGQIPNRWPDENALDVTVRLTTTSRKWTTHLTALVAENGTITPR